MRESVVNDLMDEIEMDWLTLKTLTDVSELEKASADRTKEVESNDYIIPGLEEVINCFKGVEEMVIKSGIEDEVRHSHRAKRANPPLLTAHAEQSRSKRRQTPVNECFV